jgi:N4-(beta-N-acetylglucosaminyl)-L-asparaginase
MEMLQELDEGRSPRNKIPLVINTWNFTEATQVAWQKLKEGGSVLDAVEVGCTRCEELQCDGTVGFGGSPDENGETTLDAMIMDGQTHSTGAVACLRRIKPAISVARKVMEHTKHSLLAGDLATAFAIKMGFKEENLTTPESADMHLSWKNNSCQPNFWKNVSPDPTKSCGPYMPNSTVTSTKLPEDEKRIIDRFNHDTISMVVIDAEGKIASGTSSNGARNKIAGRVGDAPIVGAGSYVDKDVGGAAATGDGDVMMRFLPSLIAVEKMREGMTPKEAASFAMARIARFYPNFSGALVAANLAGEYGAACHGIPGGFPFSVRNEEFQEVKVELTNCTLARE